MELPFCVPPQRAGQIMISSLFENPAGPCIIIAEVGANHNQDLPTAIELINVAAEAKADAIKFQVYSAATLYTQGATPKNIWSTATKTELPRKWLSTLSIHAARRKIAFLATPFDRPAIDALVALGMPAIKIASYEIGDLPLIGYAAAKGRPMILSTGLASYGDIQDALEICRAAGNHRLALLQCTSLYPAPFGAANLRAIETLHRAFGIPVGLSDHTRGIHIAGAAVALGARCIEKHFTLDRSFPGPDHSFAVEPRELREMIIQIREIEAALGDGCKMGPSVAEAAAFDHRRSLVAAQAIVGGARLTREMIASKRPGGGIQPKFLDHVIGRIAKDDIGEDAVLAWDLLL